MKSAPITGFFMIDVVAFYLKKYRVVEKLTNYKTISLMNSNYKKMVTMTTKNYISRFKKMFSGILEYKILRRNLESTLAPTLRKF